MTNLKLTRQEAHGLLRAIETRRLDVLASARRNRLLGADRYLPVVIPESQRRFPKRLALARFVWSQAHGWSWRFI